MNILCLDIGKKQIGIAISLTSFFAKEYSTIKYDDNSIKTILDIAKKEDINKIVIGLPINMDESEGEMAKFVRKFASELKKKSQISLVFLDERLTTQEAERQLRQMGFDSTDIKKRIDQYSAKVILEDYLN